MHLDAIALGADDPTALARFWSRAMEASALDHGPLGVEIATPVVSLAPVLRPGPGEVDPRTRLTDLGARAVDSGPGSPWRVFADPSGNELRLSTPDPAGRQG